MSGEAADIFMVIHQGEYLGEKLESVYVLLLGLGLLGMIFTGLFMVRRLSHNRPAKQQSKMDFRRLHRLLAPIVFLPLIISAVTGIIYRVGKSWFGLSSEQAEIFMMIHQGEYLGDFWKSIYVFLVGLGLVAMLLTGINMTGLLRKRRNQVTSPDQTPS
jgi:uncharacterized iron-regulated membrane protein